jgi:acyl-CoA thioester hydrolase
MTEPVRSSIDVEVRYIETDQMGHVHHANYEAWFELARTRFCADAGFPYPRIEAMGYLLVVTAMELRYRQPAFYGDVVAVSTWIAELRSRRMRFAYEVCRGADLLATGSSEHYWVERDGRRPVRMPESLHAGFARLAGAGGEPERV